MASHVQFADVDLESCLGQLFGVQKLAGRGNMTLNVDGSGKSVMALTGTLNGTASLNAHGGALVGINVEQLLRRLERRPLSGAGDFRSGRTPFDELAISLKIDQGMVSVDDMHVDGPAVRLAVAGQASVPMRDLDLKGTATLISTATDNQFELPFVVQGRWEDPIMLPDPQSLIRHSGAAAPLLDAVKGHTAGEAVRSVIDQLLANPSGSCHNTGGACAGNGSAKNRPIAAFQTVTNVGRARNSRGRWRYFYDWPVVKGIGYQFARLRAVIVAKLHDGPRLRHDRDQAIVKRLRRDWLDQELVDTEPDRLDHAPALAVGTEHDDRNVRHRKHTGRAHDADQFSAAQ